MQASPPTRWYFQNRIAWWWPGWGNVERIHVVRMGVDLAMGNEFRLGHELHPDVKVTYHNFAVECHEYTMDRLTWTINEKNYAYKSTSILKEETRE